MHVLFPGDRPIGIDDQFAAEDFALRRRDEREDHRYADRRRNELGRPMVHGRGLAPSPAIGPQGHAARCLAPIAADRHGHLLAAAHEDQR